MESKLVDIFLKVEVKEKTMIAHLQFSSHGAKKIYLDEQTICFDNRTRGDYFLIKNSNGKIVDYTGMMVKREINPEYFITLNPGEIVETTINLNEVYEIKKGKKYTIQYSTYHPHYLDEQDFCKIESNVVEVPF